MTLIFEFNTVDITSIRITFTVEQNFPFSMWNKMVT